MICWAVDVSLQVNAPQSSVGAPWSRQHDVTVFVDELNSVGGEDSFDIGFVDDGSNAQKGAL